MTNSVSLLHFTDVHLQDHNPPSRLGSYRQDIMDKLRRVGDIGKAYGVDLYTCGGDWFHDKAPTKTSYSMVYELGTVLKSYLRPVLTVPGNHDIRFDRTATIPEQPLGSLLNGGIVVIQNGQIFRAGDVSVGMYGFDFQEEPDLDGLHASQFKDDVTYKVLSLHVYASPRGGLLHGKTRLFSYKELLALGYDVVLLGHFHADQGVQTLTREDGSSCQFVNIGSLSRGEYGDEALSRVPKCCVVSFSPDGVTCEEVPVGARPSSEVFDVAAKQEMKRQDLEAAAFVEQLKATALATKEDEGASEQPEEMVDNLGVDDEEVLLVVKELLYRARESLAPGKAGRP